MYNAEANRKHFQKNKARRMAENKARMGRVVDWVIKYRSCHPCTICGEADERCLDFHHRKPEEKEIEVSNAVRMGWSVPRLLTEIAKCEILCANCHRKLHRGRLV